VSNDGFALHRRSRVTGRDAAEYLADRRFGVTPVRHPGELSVHR
jgi:hypothetical protein